MRAADLFAVGGFVTILAIGLVLSSLFDRASHHPAQRIRARMRKLSPSKSSIHRGSKAKL